jgi:hypothetical protein
MKFAVTGGVAKVSKIEKSEEWRVGLNNLKKS